MSLAAQSPLEWFDPFRCQKRVATFRVGLYCMAVENKKKLLCTALQIFTFSLWADINSSENKYSNAVKLKKCVCVCVCYAVCYQSEIYGFCRGLAGRSYLPRY